ncbi:MAG: YqgE/AlgH family protein [Mariprofundaceae bacterium]
MRLSELRGQFLLAMPSMIDKNFHHGVVLICHHDDEGCMGFLVNRPHNISVGSVLGDMKLRGDHLLDIPTYEGGPVEPFRGFVIHDGELRYESTLSITPGIQLTTSRDVLEDVASGNGPDSFILALGYAGWSEGQLEQEINRNDWLIAPARSEILFHAPVEHRWLLGARELGIEPDQLSLHAGHA